MITIFTPTYNRANTLHALYKSLKNQTDKNFEWLIVDDGSSDGTEPLILNWIQEGVLNINYKKQKNSGKHIAINTGLNFSNGSLFFIVDSDDFLLPNAVELVLEKSKQIELIPNVGGLAFRRIDKRGGIIGDKLPDEEYLCSVTARCYQLGIKGDFVEIFKTQILKKYKFPLFNLEKFCPEGLIWHRISREYDLLHFDIPLYVCEYLEGGLSDGSILNRRKSINYTLLTYKELFENPQVSFKYKVKNLINYWRFGLSSNKSISKLYEELGRGILPILCLPLGLVYKIKDDKIIRNKDENSR